MVVVVVVVLLVIVARRATVRGTGRAGASEGNSAQYAKKARAQHKLET